MFTGVIVNNKGEMKGSAITGKRFPNQTERKVKSILIKQVQNIKEIRHCEKKTNPILMKISEYRRTKKFQARWPRSAQTCGRGSLPTRAPFAEMQQPSCLFRADQLIVLSDGQLIIWSADRLVWPSADQLVQIQSEQSGLAKIQSDQSQNKGQQGWPQPT